MEGPGCTTPLSGHVTISGIWYDAYRVELLGIYVILSTISNIERYNSYFAFVTLKIGYDNEKSGWITGVYTPTVAIHSKHFDLVKDIRWLRTSLTISIIFYHLYGHQDQHTSVHLFPWGVQLNIIMDRNTQQASNTANESSSFIPNATFLHEGWIVDIGGVKLQDNIATHIRQWIGKQILRRYSYKKGMIARNIFLNIDFEPLRHYLSSQSRAFQLWFAKYWTGFCEIGAKMKQMKLWDNDLCPCCRQIPERNTMHIYFMSVA